MANSLENERGQQFNKQCMTSKVHGEHCMQPCCRIMIGECTNLVPFKVVCQEALPIHSLSIQSGFLSLNITTIQKQLEQEHRALDMKFKFITELKADRKSTRLNSSHVAISYAVFCLKKKKQKGNAAKAEYYTASAI